MHDNVVSKSQYWNLSDKEIDKRLNEFKELLDAGYNLAMPGVDEHPELYGYGKLARFVAPNGDSAMCLRNDSNGDELTMDIYFHLPKESVIMGII